MNTLPSSTMRIAVGAVAAVLLALAAGSIGWAVTIGVVAALSFAGFALLPRLARRRAIAARDRDALRERADRQNRWALRGDSRGLYGPDGAELMRRIAEPIPGKPAVDTDADVQVAAVAYTPEDLATLLADRPACWRYAVFASVLVQRRAALQPRLRDQELGYAPPSGGRLRVGFELGRYLYDLLEQMLALVEQAEVLMLSPGFTRMFGDPRDEDTADADAIVHAANRLMDLHERILGLAEKCRGVNAPIEHADVVRDCARVLDAPLEGYRRFVDEFVSRVGEMAEMLPHARGTIELDPVMLAVDDSGVLIEKACAGLTKLSAGARRTR
ncbi:hypothetical protein KIH27_17995 [Mycobacterium sp. M1]|uniref:Cell division protein FtsK n=1 Tax=Mycolicibacter acidiphilus TaxID=2835306 RepID=A0ABS5RMN5_9MYCO|nr:hypothetical protein [Mycolicibacter acidiphilus]MBS9535481.1 hypothetical protein [Mycolicibacter acidiphilus]